MADALYFTSAPELARHTVRIFLRMAGYHTPNTKLNLTKQRYTWNFKNNKTNVISYQNWNTAKADRCICLRDFVTSGLSDVARASSRNEEDAREDADMMSRSMIVRRDERRPCIQ